VIDTEYLRVKQKDTGHELTVSRRSTTSRPRPTSLLEGRGNATDAGQQPAAAEVRGGEEDRPPQRQPRPDRFRGQEGPGGVEADDRSGQ
jgi:hypothetical protein